MIGNQAWRIAFERIGRRDSVTMFVSCELEPAATLEGRLSEAIGREIKVQRLLYSSNVAVIVNLEAGTVSLGDGGFGHGAITRAERAI